MRAYTRTHLERAARLALFKRLTTDDQEQIVRETVSMVAEDEPVYPRWAVLKIAIRAVDIFVGPPGFPGGVTPAEAAEKALDEVS